MWIHASAWLDEDPLPVPPAAFGTAAYWRWTSARTLAAKEAMTTTQPQPLTVTLTDVDPPETLILTLARIPDHAAGSSLNDSTQQETAHD